ncbi:hypothetical protein GVX81_00130 [[Haemophilus] felis]|nr:hypothetical protein [[Haemophilus] felis]NBI39964.1 hypothetical protein [[Haemophilus] felis]
MNGVENIERKKRASQSNEEIAYLDVTKGKTHYIHYSLPTTEITGFILSKPPIKAMTFI